MTAFVFGVTARRTASGSMVQSSSQTSTKTGVAPVYATGLAEATQVLSGRITSSPGPTPMVSKARWSAAVQEGVAMAYFTPRVLHTASSNRFK